MTSRKITTSDCKKFLSNYFLSDPKPIADIWEGEYPCDIAINKSRKPINWVRVWKMKPTDSLWYAAGSGYNTSNGFKQFDQIKCVRCFVLSPIDFDTLVQFMVIEDTEGTLHLGDCIGE